MNQTSIYDDDTCTVCVVAFLPFSLFILLFRPFFFPFSPFLLFVSSLPCQSSLVASYHHDAATATAADPAVLIQLLLILLLLTPKLSSLLLLLHRLCLCLLLRRRLCLCLRACRMVITIFFLCNKNFFSRRGGERERKRISHRRRLLLSLEKDFSILVGGGGGGRGGGGGSGRDPGRILMPKRLRLRHLSVDVVRMAEESRGVVGAIILEGGGGVGLVSRVCQGLALPRVSRREGSRFFFCGGDDERCGLEDLGFSAKEACWWWFWGVGRCWSRSGCWS